VRGGMVGFGEARVGRPVRLEHAPLQLDLQRECPQRF